MLAGRCLGECDVIKHPIIEEIIEGVFKWWKRYPNVKLYERVLIEIGRGYDKTVEGLLSALNDKSMLVRRSSAEALGNIGGELAVEGLLSALNDEYRYVRISAAEALGNIGSELAVERLK